MYICLGEVGGPTGFPVRLPNRPVLESIWGSLSLVKAEIATCGGGGMSYFILVLKRGFIAVVLTLFLPTLGPEMLKKRRAYK